MVGGETRRMGALANVAIPTYYTAITAFYAGIAASYAGITAYFTVIPSSSTVIPAKAGIRRAQNRANVPLAVIFLGSCFRRNDDVTCCSLTGPIPRCASPLPAPGSTRTPQTHRRSPCSPAAPLTPCPAPSGCWRVPR